MSGETKAEKFERIGAKRVQNALDAIRKLGNLGSPGYEYTEEQIEKAMNAIQVVLNDTEEKLRARFDEQEENEPPKGFTF